MFERFTTPARESVLLARENASRRGDPQIGTEHLLLGMLQVPDGLVVRVLGMYGLTHADVDAALDSLAGEHGPDDLDADALRAIGIDLDTVRDKIEAAFGAGALDRPRDRRRRGRIPFTPRAKKVLELGLREALRLRHKSIGDGHILLGILREGDGLAAKVLADSGIVFDSLRQHVEDELSPPAQSESA
jgi:ATP-dependent Clp protease ATP-binding subunit ClpA